MSIGCTPTTSTLSYLSILRLHLLAIIFDSILSYCLANLLLTFMILHYQSINLGNNHNISKNVKINTGNYEKSK